MKWGEIESFFCEHLSNIFFRSIERSIDYAHTKPGEEGVLAALGLLCYTEAVGKFVPPHKPRNCSENFNAFFDRLGKEYEALRKNLPRGKGNIYDVLRCGLTHQGKTKEPCRIRMVKGREACGVWKAKSGGGYIFSVEKYYEDFRKESWKLYGELLLDAHPELMKRKPRGRE